MNGSCGETQRHRDLKRRAVAWAVAHEFGICALEVRLPRSGFRADVAAAMLSGADGCPGETAVFECKQARSDLLRDATVEQETITKLQAISLRRAELENAIGVHLPNLRRGETLFPECDVYDFSAIRHDGLRAVRREESRLRAKLCGGTKFDRVRRYRCSDRLYLVIAPGVMEPHEAPPGWGVLLAVGDGLEVVRKPERLACDTSTRLALLQSIALAGTRSCLSALGIAWDELVEKRHHTLPP